MLLPILQADFAVGRHYGHSVAFGTVDDHVFCKHVGRQVFRLGYLPSPICVLVTRMQVRNAISTSRPRQRRNAVMTSSFIPLQQEQSQRHTGVGLETFNAASLSEAALTLTAELDSICAKTRMRTQTPMKMTTRIQPYRER